MGGVLRVVMDLGVHGFASSWILGIMVHLDGKKHKAGLAVETGGQLEEDLQTEMSLHTVTVI